MKLCCLLTNTDVLITRRLPRSLHVRVWSQQHLVADRGTAVLSGGLKHSWFALTLTHSAVVSHESGVSLLVGEVWREEHTERVFRGGDDLLSWHRLRVRLLPATEQCQHLSLSLHLEIQQKHVSHFIYRIHREKQLKSPVIRQISFSFTFLQSVKLVSDSWTTSSYRYNIWHSSVKACCSYEFSIHCPLEFGGAAVYNGKKLTKMPHHAYPPYSLLAPCLLQDSIQM